MHRLSSLLAICLVFTLAAGCGGGGTPVVEGATPLITSIEPASGGVAGGTPIVIRGANLANPVAGEYQVLIGGQPADAIEVIDDSQVECRTPPGTQGAADVEVVTVEGAGGVPGGFVFHPPPTVTSITPNEGTRDGGTPVTITGTGFAANDPGETACAIELKGLTSVVVVDDTTITGVTPSSWTETFKDVTVRNRNGTGVLDAGFTYVGPTPQIYAVDPAEGTRGGGTLITITGEYFTLAGGDLSVQIGTSDATLVTRIDDETLTCFTPFSASAGFVDVSVGNNNGTGSLPDGFYYIPEPVPTAVVPNEGPIDGGTPVTITGLAFAGGGTTNVLFGTAPATNVVVVDDSNITCVTPKGSGLGSVDVVVQNDNGLGTIPDGFTFTAPDFWWEETFGTASTSYSYSGFSTVSLPYGFPFFAQNWNSVYAMNCGHLDFGSYNNAWNLSNTLFTFPHITAMGVILNPSSTYNLYFSSHVTGRTIVTYDRVPEYSAQGANSVQIHLHQSGIFAIVYKSTTFRQSTVNTTSVLVAVNPGGGTNVGVDWTSGPSGSATDAMNEQWTTASDLSNSVLMFVPNGSGGYDTIYTSGVPTDPNP